MIINTTILHKNITKLSWFRKASCDGELCKELDENTRFWRVTCTKCQNVIIVDETTLNDLLS